MTPTQRAAMRGILAYFESGNGVPVDRAVIRADCAEVAALRAALAEPVQEPLGYFSFRDGEPDWSESCVCPDPVYPVDADDDRVSAPIYTAPQPQQPSPPADVSLLDDWDILGMWHATSYRVPMCNHYNYFAREVEKAVRQKAGLA